MGYLAEHLRCEIPCGKRKWDIPLFDLAPPRRVPTVTDTSRLRRDARQHLRRRSSDLPRVGEDASLDGLLLSVSGHFFSHRRCSAGQPRASERSSRRPGDTVPGMINSHAESVWLLLEPQGCSLLHVLHYVGQGAVRCRAARFQRATNRSAAFSTQGGIAPRAGPGLPCRAPSVRNHFGMRRLGNHLTWRHGRQVSSL